MKVKYLPIVSAVLLTFSATASAAVVEFHIPAGTGVNSWNSRATQIEVAVGDTLRLINDDSVVHALHTNDGIPCEHGDDIAPNGGSADCVIAEAYDSDADGPLYDHYHTAANFWLLAH